MAEAHRDPAQVARLKASERYYDGHLRADHPFRAAYDAGVSRLEVEGWVVQSAGARFARRA